MRVLAGDIGGTKTAVAIAEVDARNLAIESARTYPRGEWRGREEILRDFLSAKRRRPRFATFGIAGPVSGGRARVTKLPWVLDERLLSLRLGIPRGRPVHHFVAAARGIPRRA